MTHLVTFAIIASLLMTGAIFGFFYAWVCSVMWGLDAADPRVAISAMQAVNASIRNAVFATAFFGTPVMLLVTAILVWARSRAGALAFGLAALVYLGGGLIVTLAVNVPMNEALARVEVPQSVTAAREIWEAYSGPWQAWNLARTVVSGTALTLAAWGAIVVARLG